MIFTIVSYFPEWTTYCCGESTTEAEADHSIDYSTDEGEAAQLMAKARMRSHKEFDNDGEITLLIDGANADIDEPAEDPVRTAAYLRIIAAADKAYGDLVMAKKQAEADQAAWKERDRLRVEREKKEREASAERSKYEELKRKYG